MIVPGFSHSCCFGLSDLLNQYTEREYPGALDARGVADAGFTVDVNGVPATRTGADYYGVGTFNNSSGAALGELEIEITDPGPPPVPQPTEVYSLATTGTTDPYVIPETPEEFAYDLDGNLISDGRWDYVWDGENRLISMTIRAQVVTDTAMTRQRMLFDYDSAGRRIRSRTEEYVSSAWVPVSEVRYLYDGWNVVAELDAMGVTRSMTWGLDLSGTEQGAGGVGGLLWTVDDNDDGMIPGYDGNGNIIAWVDASDGSLAGTREYGAFGEDVTFSGVAHEIPFGFSTKYQDRLSGLYYYGYRYYDTSTGRWLSRDPLEEQGGLNLYGMLGNNVVNLWDLLGLKPCDTEWEIDVDSIKIVTTLLTKATATIQDPESVIKGYIGDRVKNRAKEAVEKRSRFLTILKEAQGTAKSFLGRVGFMGEILVSHGFIIDSISMDVDFNCCKCDGSGGLKWEKMKSSFKRDGLFLNLRSMDGRNMAIEEYVRIMMGTAGKVINQCKTPKNE